MAINTQPQDTSQTEQQVTQTEFPIPNSFKQFATMTYSVSLYLQSPEHLNSMVNSQNKSVKGLKLLIQSGGINKSPDPSALGAERSEFFNNDFYIDDLSLKGLISGTATGSATNSFEINFTITEPAGLSFLQRLHNAIHDFNGKNKDFNFVNQTYLMVIRFYGYDKDGNQITATDIDKSSDAQAFSEKWVPFIIKNISFRLSSDKVIYAVEGVPTLSFAGNDKIHGTIPFNMGLQGQTLEHLLSGSDVKGEAGITLSGLKKALNDHQLKLKKDGLQEYADTYDFEFQSDSIKHAKLIQKGTTALNRTGLYNGQDNDTALKLATDTTKVLKDTRTIAINAGMKIITFLDLVIRTSSFISDQYKKVNDDNKDKTTKAVPQKKDNTPLKWFKIRPRVTYQEGKYDKKRNMYAQNITYVISEYEVQTLNTTSFDTASQMRIHKEYDFWFTGKNTEVLGFNQEFNALYYTTFSNKDIYNKETGIVGAADKQNNIRTMRAYKVNTYTDNAGGKENQTAEQAANAASVLYSPADQGTVTVDIVGDPDWIAQSQLFYAASGNNSNSPTMPDRSVNYDAAEVFFAINFNTIVDYDLNTGLADTTKKNLSADPAGTEGTVSQYSFGYRANEITTELAGGRFTQRLTGTVVWLPEEYVTGKKASANASEREVVEKKNAKHKIIPAANNTVSTSSLNASSSPASLTIDNRLNESSANALVSGSTTQERGVSEATPNSVIRKR